MNLEAGSWRRIPTAEGAVLRFFRFSRGLNEKEFALLAEVDVATVRRWENGGAPLSRDWLADLLGDLLGIPPEAVDEALSAHRRATVREALEGPYALSEAEHRFLGRASMAAGQAGAATARRELALDRLRHRAARDTAWAKEKWSRLKKLPADRQAKVLHGLRGSEGSWALAVQLGEASTAAAADSAAEALRLARCCLDLARESPGTERWRLRLLGACEPYEANALRVGGNLPAARGAFAYADEHWDQGAGGDPAGLLDANRRLELKASFLQFDGRTEEALFLLEQALRDARTDHLRGRLLIQKATCQGIAGEYETAIATLRQADLLIDARREPRLLCVIQFNLGNIYCHLDDYKAAEDLLPLVETLAVDLRTKLDEQRMLWLRARTKAGLGRKE
jgi:tetratricopeptide (TPR) repeat protein